MKKILLIIAIISIGIIDLSAQNRPIDELRKTDRFGFTTMFYYSYQNWSDGSRETYGSMRFDSFRLWAQTDIDKKVFAAVQYRLLEGWRTPQYLYLGYNINEKNSIHLGQTWVPFGFGYQPFDDWGNIAYYVGLQDDYDYGAVWTGKFNRMVFNAGFFKNQQLSESSAQRTDADIYAGDVYTNGFHNDAIRNQEVNQLNLRAVFKPEKNGIKMQIGASGMIGGIYNRDTKITTQRYAAAFHYGLDIEDFKFNLQYTWYKYDQVLPDTGRNDYMYVSSSNYIYGIPINANILTSSAALDIMGERLTAHVNLSYLWGGTSETSSYMVSWGARSFWKSFEVFAECIYGKDDPQLSGDATGYGRDVGSYDFRFHIKLFYKLHILSEDTIERFIQKN